MDYVIEHHGIKGQKWGIRRFQNEDGTLTEAGKKRYFTLDKRNDKLEIKAEKEQKRADRYKQKVPNHYLTDFGKHKAEKYIRKAVITEGKVARYKKKIEKNKRIQEMLISNVSSLTNSNTKADYEFKKDLSR